MNVALHYIMADLNISVVNINELTEIILKRLRPIAAQKNVELVFESFRPITAEVDEVKLTLALTNFVENAIKYNVENGSVYIWIGQTLSGKKIIIEDTGIGIPKEHHDRIFERFYRVDKSHSRETGGTGLGLSIVKNFVEMMQGTIEVHSKKGEGTSFVVEIPFDKVKKRGSEEEKETIAIPAQLAEQEAEPEKKEVDLTGKKVLSFTKI